MKSTKFNRTTVPSLHIIEKKDKTLYIRCIALYVVDSTGNSIYISTITTATVNANFMITTHHRLRRHCNSILFAFSSRIPRSICALFAIAFATKTNIESYIYPEHIRKPILWLFLCLAVKMKYQSFIFISLLNKEVCGTFFFFSVVVVVVFCCCFWCFLSFESYNGTFWKHIDRTKP